MIETSRGTNVLAAAALCLGLLAAGPVSAQVVDPQTALAAQALYDQATAEMDAGNYASACRKLEEVIRLVPEGIGAKLTLGDCYERSGKLASAWSQFALAESLAARAGQVERAQKASERAAALKPRLATLTVMVPEAVRGTPGLAITRDGVPLGEAQWGTPVPVDTGDHTIIATAPGRKPLKGHVIVTGDGERVSVELQPLKVKPRLVESSWVEPTPGPSAASPKVPQAEAATRVWQQPVAIGAMGLALASLGVGAALGGTAIAKNNQSNENNHCDAQHRCDSIGVDLREQAVRFGNASTVLFLAGGLLLTGGMVLYLTAPPDERKSDGVQAVAPIQARIGALPGGIVFDGRW